MREQIEHLKAAVQNKRSELARAIPSQSTQLIICEGEHDVLDRIPSRCSRSYLNFSDGNRWEAYWKFCKLVITTGGT